MVLSGGFGGGRLLSFWAFRVDTYLRVGAYLKVGGTQMNMVNDFIFLFCFDRNELIPKLKEYNTFFEGRKALQLTSKEVRMALENTTNCNIIISSCL